MNCCFHHCVGCGVLCGLVQLLGMLVVPLFPDGFHDFSIHFLLLIIIVANVASSNCCSGALRGMILLSFQKPMSLTLKVSVLVFLSCLVLVLCILLHVIGKRKL